MVQIEFGRGLVVYGVALGRRWPPEPGVFRRGRGEIAWLTRSGTAPPRVRVHGHRDDAGAWEIPVSKLGCRLASNAEIVTLLPANHCGIEDGFERPRR